MNHRLTPNPRLLITPLCFVLALMGAGGSLAAEASVTVHSDQPGMRIPTDFLGFSVEKNLLSRDCLQPGNAALITLFRNLGPGVLRIGGNQVDATLWSRNEKNPFSPMADGKRPEKATPLTLGPLSVDRVFAFAKASGWRVIYGVNLGANQPGMAADEAEYALKAGGSSVMALEIGNEPNLLHRKSQKTDPDAKGVMLENRYPKGYGYAQFHDEFETHYRAILARSPHAPIAGPATTRFCGWVPDFLRDFKKRIVLVTSHGYPLTAQEKDPKSPRFASIKNLLGTRSDEDWLPKLKAATAASLPWRLGEFNSATGGGKRGVSDTFASALWGVDFFFDVAEHGGAGVNLHNTFTPGGYSPLCYLPKENRYEAAPLYYGMLLFHQAAQGRLVPVECKTPANLVAHAALGDDRKLRVQLINKDLTQPVVASVQCGSQHGEAEVIRLSAPSVTSTEGVMLAGTAVALDGTWTPKPGEKILYTNGKCEVTLPLASAALLILKSDP